MGDFQFAFWSSLLGRLLLLGAVLFILCVGDPDLIDAAIARLMP